MLSAESLWLCLVLFCVSSTDQVNDNDNYVLSNPFDKFFPDLTTEKDKTPIFKMYRWRNHPTAYTNRPPPRGRVQTTIAPTTEEPDDGQGDNSSLHPLEVAWRNHKWKESLYEDSSEKKSRSAARDMSYSSSFGSEDFDSPEIPSDFDARFGLNKTRYVKTPHPILSRRESFEFYGKAPERNSDEDVSFEFSSSEEKGVSSTQSGIMQPTTKPSVPVRTFITTLKTQTKSIFLTTFQSDSTNKVAIPPPLPKPPPKPTAAVQKPVTQQVLAKETIKGQDPKIDQIKPQQTLKQEKLTKSSFPKNEILKSTLKLTMPTKITEENKGMPLKAQHTQREKSQKPTISPNNLLTTLQQNHESSKVQSGIKSQGEVLITTQKTQKPLQSPLQAPTSEVKTSSKATVTESTQRLSPTMKAVLTTLGADIKKEIPQQSLSFAASQLLDAQNKIVNPIDRKQTQTSVTKQSSSKPDVVQKPSQQSQGESSKQVEVKQQIVQSVDSKQQSKQTVSGPSPSVQPGVAQKLSPKLVLSQQQSPKPPKLQLTLRPQQPPKKLTLRPQTLKSVSSLQPTPPQIVAQQIPITPTISQQQKAQMKPPQQEITQKIVPQPSGPKKTPQPSEQQCPKQTVSKPTAKPKDQHQTLKPATNQNQVLKTPLFPQITLKPITEQQQPPKLATTQQQTSKVVSPKQQATPVSVTVVLSTLKSNQQQTSVPQTPNQATSAVQPVVSKPSTIGQQEPNSLLQPTSAQPQTSVPVISQQITSKPKEIVQTALPSIVQHEPTAESPPPQRTVSNSINIQQPIIKATGTPISQTPITTDKKILRPIDKLTFKPSEIPQSLPITVANQQGFQPSIITQSSAVTQKLIETQQPVVTRHQVITKIPHKIQNPIVTQQSSVFQQQPVNTQNPIVAHKPVVTEQPIATENPAVTQNSVVTQQSVVQNLDVTQKPFLSEQPIATENPAVTQNSIVTQHSIVTQNLYATQNPALTEQSIPTENQAVTKKTIETQQSVITQQSVVTNSAVLTQNPVVTQNPFATQQPAATHLSDTHHVTHKLSHAITHAPFDHQPLTVLPSTKKATMRAYDKILNKAGDIIKPKATFKTMTEKVESTSPIHEKITQKEEILLTTSTHTVEPEGSPTFQPVQDFLGSPSTSTSEIQTTLEPADEAVHTRPQIFTTTKQVFSQHTSQKGGVTQDPRATQKSVDLTRRFQLSENERRNISCCEAIADLDEDIYREKVRDFFNSQKKTEEEIVEIEAKTRLQRGSDFWWNVRKYLLTASNFAAVCKRMPHTRCDSLVSRLIYGEEYSSYSMIYGRLNEKNAIERLKQLGLNITECGLFIDKELPFLAATPDGLIGSDGILEIKCPSSAETLTPEQAILRRKGMMSTFWKIENKNITGVNKNHSYYYQIQGQLHITQRNFALFVVWTPKGIKIEKIEKDDLFWNEFMVEKLKAFYMDCLLPEIIDPRRKRNLPIRNPQYILKAISQRENLRSSNGQPNFFLTPVPESIKSKEWEPLLPKVDRSRRRRKGRIFLKPPPEDWPEPEAFQGTKEITLPPEYSATIPPMGTYIDTGKKRSGFKDGSFVSPPFMEHRKIDFVPIPGRPGATDVNGTVSPSNKWRLKGRKDVTFGVYQPRGVGLSMSLTMRPALSEYTLDNTSHLIPTVRTRRPYRTYINFRQRGPLNVGRLFSPHGPPFPQPPPQHFASFPQPPFPRYPRPPFRPFPRGPAHPPPPYGPPPPHYGPYPPPPPPPYGPPPPFAHVPPPPPHFHRGPGLVPPPYGPPPAPPLPQAPFQPPTPPVPPYAPSRSDLPPPPPDLPPSPFPSPYPTGAVFPTVRPFYENIPTISPIDNIPAPWPRRKVYMEPRTFPSRVYQPRNYSAYTGLRRGRGYEQFGKADLRPKRIKFFDENAVEVGRGLSKSSVRKGSGYGVEFQTDITRGPYVPGPMFVRRTWPTRPNQFGYEPYRRSSDKRRPYGLGKFGAERPPVLGDFGQFRPYRRLDFDGKAVYNYSRPTRSYTFPPRLRMAIRNATYQRGSFRRFDRFRFGRERNYEIWTETLKPLGMADHIVHDHDYHGNLITPKGRIMNMEELRKLFTYPPTEAGIEAVTAETAEVSKKMSMAMVKKLMDERLANRPQAKPRGMTAKEALRAAAREAIKESEKEAWERGENVGRRRRGGWRPRGERGSDRGRGFRADRGRGMGRGGWRSRGDRGRGRFGFGSGRNYRRVKRSTDEELERLQAQVRVRRELKLYDSESGDYLTGPGADSSSSSGGKSKQKKPDRPPLRMRRWHTRRGKGRPMRWG